MNNLLTKQKDKDIHNVLTKNKLMLQQYFYVIFFNKLLINNIKKNISTAIDSLNNNNKYNIFHIISTGQINEN